MAGVRLNAVDQRDLDEITAAIRQAHLAADYVLLSIHAHYPGVWLEDFARAAIDAGVDVVFAHGPHTVTGIEIYHDRPIFYSLGNFAFQYELSEKLPADAFEHFGLDPDSSLDAYFAAEREADGYQSFNRRPETWEGLGAVVTFEGTRLANVRLVPIDLGFAQELPARGLPRLARGAIRDAVFSAVIDQSRRYGTIVQFDASGDAATISLAGGR
jgi:poly-gamma-glutamate synthesis protein (capsule biosynthesis protein)